MTTMLANMPFKFFPKDILSGKPTNKGDKFTAMCFGAEQTFTMTERHGDTIMATLD